MWSLPLVALPTPRQFALEVGFSFVKIVKTTRVQELLKYFRVCAFLWIAFECSHEQELLAGRHDLAAAGF